MYLCFSFIFFPMRLHGGLQWWEKAQLLVGLGTRYILNCFAQFSADAWDINLKVTLRNGTSTIR